MIGTVLGQYRIIRALGAGGMGEVYAAEDSKLKRQVALKLLPPDVACDPTRRARFQREAEAVAALDHPNIVTIHSIESAQTNGPEPRTIQFLTMQLVYGTTLGQLIPPKGLPLELLLELSVPLAGAIGAAHTAGITHRDLKPQNIMVGDDGRLRVLDFGIAKFDRPAEQAGSDETSTLAAVEDLTVEGSTLGTAAYMSPEQVKGLPADPRSDVFSLGAVMYEMTTGQRPFVGGSSAEIASAILRDTPASICEQRHDIPRGVEQLIQRCLEKEAAERYPSAVELHRDLESLQREVVASGERRGVEEALQQVVSPARRRSPRTGGSTQTGGSNRLPLPDRPSLAVLPFVNLSSDPEQDYFADGLWTDINADLVKVSGLFLISQTTTGLYKGKSVNPEQVGFELGVSHVLEGTVRTAGERVRITAQLVATQTGEPIWAERYDRKLEDLFALQDEINEEIVTALDVRLLHGESHRIVRRSIKSPVARDAYYRALGAMLTLEGEAIVEVRRLLSSVAEIEPTSPLSFVFAAFSHYFEANSGLPDPEHPSFDKALSLAERAIELDDPTGSGHMVKGMVCLRRGQHEAALEASEKAVQDRPSCPWAYALRGAIFNYIGKPQQAIALAKSAIRHSPFVPAVFPAVLANGHYLDGQYDEATEDALGVIGLAPDTLEAHVVLAAVLAASGRAAEAEPTLREIRRIKPDFALEEFAASQPYKDAAVLARLLSDLRAAGLS